VPVPNANLIALSAAISAQAGTAITILSADPIGAGANAAHHFKLTDQAGRFLSLKCADRVGDGTRHEYLAWRTANLLGLSGAGQTALIAVPQDAEILQGRESVLIEWMRDAKEIQSLPNPPSPDRCTSAVARQIGGWIWLAMRLGISDRHMGNWVWSSSQASIAMIDLEDWQYGTQTLMQFAAYSGQVMGCANAYRTFARDMFAGAKQAKDVFAAKEAGILAEFARLAIADPAAGKPRLRRR
jgi:hypothetical protein